MPDQASELDTEKARQQTQRIEEQLTQAEWDELCTFANRRCRSLRNIGVRLDSETPEDLVAGAVTDTATGRLTWPEHKTLAQHIRDTVLSRTSHEMKRQRRVPLRFARQAPARVAAPRFAAIDSPDRRSAACRGRRRLQTRRLFSRRLDHVEHFGLPAHRSRRPQGDRRAHEHIGRGLRPRPAPASPPTGEAKARGGRHLRTNRRSELIGALILVEQTGWRGRASDVLSTHVG